LQRNAERHLKSPAEIARLYPGYEDALERTVEIAARCTFSLDELKYE
jgi:error-prone DNA polymerase